jgi:hypothetical protein
MVQLVQGNKLRIKVDSFHSCHHYTLIHCNLTLLLYNKCDDISNLGVHLQIIHFRNNSIVLITIDSFSSNKLGARNKYELPPPTIDTMRLSLWNVKL